MMQYLHLSIFCIQDREGREEKQEYKGKNGVEIAIFFFSDPVMFWEREKDSAFLPQQNIFIWFEMMKNTYSIYSTIG